MRKWLVDSRPVDINSLLSPLLFPPFTHSGGQPGNNKVLDYQWWKTEEGHWFETDGWPTPETCRHQRLWKKINSVFSKFWGCEGLVPWEINPPFGSLTADNMKPGMSFSAIVSLNIIIYIYEFILTQKYLHIQEYELHRLILTVK